MARKTRKPKEPKEIPELDADVVKRLELLKQDKERNMELIRVMENELKKSDSQSEKGRICKSIHCYEENIGRIDCETRILTNQMSILECDDKPVRIQAFGKVSLEDKLVNAYCAKCASPDLKITKIIQIECRKCGRKRLITVRMDESKR